MKTRYSTVKRMVFSGILGALCLLGATSAQAGNGTFPKPAFNAAGELLRPDFRFRE